jgi:hypothetical protein
MYNSAEKPKRSPTKTSTASPSTTPSKAEDTEDNATVETAYITMSHIYRYYIVFSCNIIMFSITTSIFLF